MRACFYPTLVSCAIAVLVAPLAPQTIARIPAKCADCAIQQPYTAEFKITHVRTLANGTTITQESTEVQARDSQNRTMNSTTWIRPSGDRSPATVVSISDPVAGTEIKLNPHDKVATIYKLPPLEERHGCWQSESGHFTSSWPSATPFNDAVQGASAGKSVPASSVQPPIRRRAGPEKQDLGTTTILGVEAKGRRIVHTTPVGEIGNDQPLVNTQETWLSTELGIVVRELQDNPQSGTRTRELVNLTRGDPDPSTFQPPEGYEVVTEDMVPCKHKSSTLQ